MLNHIVPIAGDARHRLMDWLSERCDLPRFRERLMADEVGAYLIAGTDAALVLSVTKIEDDGRVLWIESLGGSVSAKPKSNAELIAAVLDDCEQIARYSGCSQIRIKAENRTSLKKRLFIKYGFEAIDLGRFIVMRKAL